MKKACILSAAAALLALAVCGGCRIYVNSEKPPSQDPDGPQFEIIYAPPVNGVFSGPAKAREKEVIFVLVTPSTGYQYDGKINAAAQDGSPVNISGNGERFTFTMPDTSLTVFGGSFVPDIPPKYPVHYAKYEHGVLSGPQTAVAGEMVEIRLAAELGFRFDRALELSGENGPLELKRDGGVYRFKMPAGQVDAGGGAFVPADLRPLAAGGKVFIEETDDGVFEEVHIFRYNEDLPADKQAELIFATDDEIHGARVLIVGGGGAGGAGGDWSWRGGGGGAGGVLLGTDITITAGAHEVLIGGGGPAFYGSSGFNGGSSSFGGVTAGGGGGGARSHTAKLDAGRDGGSGGGGTGEFSGGIAGLIGTGLYESELEGYTFYGHAGGAGAGMNGPGTNYGGGGGGAGEAGAQGHSWEDHNAKWATPGGAGGRGLSWTELGEIVHAGMLGLSGDLRGLAGGGSGSNSAKPSKENGAGYGGGMCGFKGFTSAVLGGFWTGQGGGRIPYDSMPFKHGLPGTGGGGGGSFNVSIEVPGAGGSGLVVIRFPHPLPD